MQVVSIPVKAGRRGKAEEIPSRRVAATAVVAACVVAVLMPPAISVLVLLGSLR